MAIEATEVEPDRGGLLRAAWLQKLGGGPLEEFGLRLWSRLQFAALRSRNDRAVLRVLEEVFREKRSLMSAFEMYLIYSLARAQAKREGSFAEVGVYRGGSARLLCELKGDRPLHLFDTFAGLPPSHAHDRGVHREGQYACGLEDVRAYLAPFPNVHFHEGLFPTTTAGLAEQRYALVHFDVDLYEGTRACLEYFYPRMVPGGVIVSHDFGILAGVERAFTEFFADKPEPIIQQPTTQVVVVKA